MIKESTKAWDNLLNLREIVLWGWVWFPLNCDSYFLRLFFFSMGRACNLEGAKAQCLYSDKKSANVKSTGA